jgi:hypothetical protein
VRRQHDVNLMESTYGWPRRHREGYPDLVGPEIDLWRDIEPFNACHEHMQVVLVNQFGWTKARIGTRLPDGMDIADLRRATDVEFGMATYEPFGISPLEPLGCGAVCVISSVCGCAGFVNHVTGGKGTPVVINADFTKLQAPMSIDDLLAMGRAERDAIEARTARQIAEELMARVPWDDAQREKLLAIGQKLIKQMGWDQVIDEGLIPMLDRIRGEVAAAV